MIKTKIHFYDFDIGKDADKGRYNALVRKLKGEGLKLFDCISLQNHEQMESFNNKIKTLESRGTITLDPKYVFSNQWNTADDSFNLRVMEWKEEIYPNRDIKRGYWLEVTPEMRELQHNTFICGYCGNREINTTAAFCVKCLESEYLKEAELFLLRFKRVDNETTRAPLTPEEKGYLLPLYIEAQRYGTTERGKKRIAKEKQRIIDDKKNAIEAANNEYVGKMWLFVSGISTDNVIYYNHTKRFCFGWRTPLSFEEEQKLKVQLKGFPLKYDIKTV
jgi:hypothetical protein